MHFGFSYVGLIYLIMGIAIMILGIGHIGIHLMHMKECEQ